MGDPGAAVEMGRAGREHVRERHLVTRSLEGELRAAGEYLERMTVHLPDGTPLELPEGATGADAAAAIGSGLARAALGVKVDGELRDLSAPLPDGARIEIATARDDDGLWLIRHDAAHVHGRSGHRAVARARRSRSGRRSRTASTTTSSSPRG